MLSHNRLASFNGATINLLTKRVSVWLVVALLALSGGSLHYEESSGMSVHLWLVGGVFAVEPAEILFADGFEPNNLPVAQIDAIGEVTLIINDQVTIDSSNSSDSDGFIVSQSWSLTTPLNSGTTLTVATSITTEFVPDIKGDYSVELVVTDDRGGTARVTKSFTVVDTPFGANTTCVADSSLISSAYPELSSLRTFNNNVYDANCNIVVLRGVWFGDGPKGKYEEHYSEATIARLANEWNINFLRIPIHPGVWKVETDYLERFVDDLVELAGKYGIYVVVGWHAEGNALTGETLAAYRDPDLALAKEALNIISNRYADKEWVLYQSFNEPFFITWDEWLLPSTELVDIIQANAPKAIVVVSGTNHARDLYGIRQKPIERNNLIYEVHAYPVGGNPNGVPWEDTVSYLAKHVPVIIGEWGFDESAGEAHLEGNISNYGIPIMNFANELELGWSAFAYTYTWPVNMVEYHNDQVEVFTDYGCFVKQSLLEAEFPISASVCNKDIAVNPFLNDSADILDYGSVLVNEYNSREGYHHIQLVFSNLTVEGVDVAPENYVLKIQYFGDSVAFDIRPWSGFATLTDYARVDEWSEYLAISQNNSILSGLKIAALAEQDRKLIELIMLNSESIIQNALANASVVIDSDTMIFWNTNLSNIVEKFNQFHTALTQL